MSTILTRHRNLLLLLLLGAVLIVSCLQRDEAVPTVAIPVIETASAPVNAVEAFRVQRDQDTLADIAALEKLCALESSDHGLQSDAAAQLQAIIDARQAQSALEGALLGSSLSPCVAVVSGGCVSIVTGKQEITDKDAALVLSLAAAHTGTAPGNVRIIPTE